jgi:hypothetical protein
MSDEKVKESGCKHPNPEDAGVYGEGLGTVHVEWCPDCGALHRKMRNFKGTDYGWQIPRKGAELEHDYARVKEYLMGEWKRGALSGPMDSELITILNKGNL